MAACGGGDDDDAGGGGGDGGGSGEATTTAPTAEPQRGGTLIYAVEADTLNPWLPSAMLCAAACHSTIGRTVFEPLVMLGNDGETYPYLLESFSANAEFTEYTLVAREGIVFHDSTPLNADAIALNLNLTRNSPLLLDSLAPISEITSDGANTVTITMNAPWPEFPTMLNSQFGYMASPTWIQGATATPPTAPPTEPVGTGPFVFAGYEPGDNGRLTATRFDGYWRGDGPTSVTGEGLPYLDGVEVRFTPDSQARTQALAAGDIDMIQTANGVEIGDLEETDNISVTILDDPLEIETSYLLINNQETVEGQPNPFHDVRVRRALAMATDNEQLSATRTAGRYPVANGPFPPDVVGHLEDTGYPEYDPEGATALLAEVEAETGSPVTIAYKTTNDPFNLTTAEQLQDMWDDVGFQVTIDQTSQDDFIGEAVGGNFQVFGWRNHAGVDPDQQFVWWSSTTSDGLALNFGRIIDEEVDRLLGVIRTSTDQDERQAAAEDLNRRFADQVFNIWNYWVFWGLAHGEHVQNVEGMTIPGAPEGVRALNMGFNLPGVIMPTEIFETSG